MSTTRPRSSISARFAAVTAAVGTVYLQMVEKLRAQRDLGRVDLSDEQIDTLARIARGLAHDSTVDAYNQGVRDGRLRARLELGEPADEVNVPSHAAHVLCPHCQRVVD